MVNKINLLRNPLLRHQYFNNGIKNKKIALFDFDVTTCKTTNKCQKEGFFTTSVPVDPQKISAFVGMTKRGIFQRSHNLGIPN